MRFEKLLLAAAALCLVCMAPACSDDDPATDPEQNETPGTPGEGEGDGDDDSGEPGEPDTPDTPALTEGVRAEGYYKGDYHDEGTGNYWINFTVEDENDPGGYYILCLDFNGSLAADPDFAALDVRDYPMNVGSGYPAGTLNGDGDTYLARHDDEGDFTYSEAQSGSAKVEMIEGLYKVTCSLLLENDEVCDFEYYGPLAFYNRTLDGNMSNLTEDVELTFTQGMAIYYGDIYEMGPMRGTSCWPRRTTIWTSTTVRATPCSWRSTSRTAPATTSPTGLIRFSTPIPPRNCLRER